MEESQIVMASLVYLGAGTATGMAVAFKTDSVRLGIVAGLWWPLVATAALGWCHAYAVGFLVETVAGWRADRRAQTPVEDDKDEPAAELPEARALPGQLTRADLERAAEKARALREPRW